GGRDIGPEIVIPRVHCVMGRAPGLPQGERYYSHPEARGQCRSCLARALSDAQLAHTSSTAAAVQQARNDPGGAAIGSSLASELYALPILAEGIQDHAHNQTRFVMIGHEPARPTGDDRRSEERRVGTASR